MSPYRIPLAWVVVAFVFGLRLEGGEARFKICWIAMGERFLETAILAPEPVLTDADVIEYKWDSHTIMITEECAKRIGQAHELRHGVYFVVIADGFRCYRGAFWSAISSSKCSVPWIDAGLGRELRIEYAGRTNGASTAEDVRSDRRVRKVFHELGKLEIAEPDDADQRR
jgi:hypothetical protein